MLYLGSSFSYCEWCAGNHRDWSDQDKVHNIYLLTRENDKRRRHGQLAPRAKKGRDKFSIKQMEKQDTTFFEISAVDVDNQHLAIQKSWFKAGHSDTL